MISELLAVAGIHEIISVTVTHCTHAESEMKSGVVLV